MTGQELRARRDALGMTQDELATALSVTPTTIARWERGEKVIGHPGMMDLALAQLAHISATPALRVPQGEFEINLFDRALRTAFDRWARLGVPLRATVAEYQSDGTWLLYVEPVREFSWGGFLTNPQIAGRCWIEADGQQDPVVCWSVPTTEHGPAQRNTAEYAPSLDWPQAVPQP